MRRSHVCRHRNHGCGRYYHAWRARSGAQYHHDCGDHRPHSRTTTTTSVGATKIVPRREMNTHVWCVAATVLMIVLAVMFVIAAVGAAACSIDTTSVAAVVVVVSASRRCWRAQCGCERFVVAHSGLHHPHACMPLALSRGLLVGRTNDRHLRHTCYGIARHASPRGAWALVSCRSLGYERDRDGSGSTIVSEGAVPPGRLWGRHALGWACRLARTLHPARPSRLVRVRRLQCSPCSPRSPRAPCSPLLLHDAC